jgi:hypothetical protein
MRDVAAYHLFVCALFPVQEGMWTERAHKYMMLPRHS